MILADIGNSYAKFYQNGLLKRVTLENLEIFKDKKVFYINVNPKVDTRSFSKWIDLEPFIDLISEYKGLGVDRKVLCSFVEDGVIVDAGSAITVDVMEQRVHQGGFIYPGLKEMLQSYKRISPRLDVALHLDISLEKLPQNTQNAVTYGILRPIIDTISSFKKRIYLTGGDGNILYQFLPEATFRESLIFDALENIVKRNSLC